VAGIGGEGCHGGGEWKVTQGVVGCFECGFAGVRVLGSGPLGEAIVNELCA